MIFPSYNLRYCILSYLNPQLWISAYIVKVLQSRVVPSISSSKFPSNGVSSNTTLYRWHGNLRRIQNFPWWLWGSISSSVHGSPRQCRFHCMFPNRTRRRFVRSSPNILIYVYCFVRLATLDVKKMGRSCGTSLKDKVFISLKISGFSARYCDTFYGIYQTSQRSEDI